MQVGQFDIKQVPVRSHQTRYAGQGRFRKDEPSLISSSGSSPILMACLANSSVIPWPTATRSNGARFPRPVVALTEPWTLILA